MEWSFPYAFRELAVDSHTGKIWIANIIDYNRCIPLSLLTDDKQLETKLEPRKFKVDNDPSETKSDTNPFLVKIIPKLK